VQQLTPTQFTNIGPYLETKFRSPQTGTVSGYTERADGNGTVATAQPGRRDRERQHAARAVDQRRRRDLRRQRHERASWHGGQVRLLRSTRSSST
jgi:hypothetical protein